MAKVDALGCYTVHGLQQFYQNYHQIQKAPLGIDEYETLQLNTLTKAYNGNNVENKPLTHLKISSCTWAKSQSG